MEAHPRFMESSFSWALPSSSFVTLFDGRLEACGERWMWHRITSLAKRQTEIEKWRGME